MESRSMWVRWAGAGLAKPALQAHSCLGIAWHGSGQRLGSDTSAFSHGPKCKCSGAL